MRFVESGPSIPNDLLTAQDNGEVIFFCGAGVSIPAGLLSFFELTVQVMKRLGVPPDSNVGRQMAQAIANNDPSLAPPFDQVFSQLQRAYTTDRIEKEVSFLLKTPRGAKTFNHQIVLKLSRDARGMPFVITTNFDHLFERAMPRLRHWFPPMLPLLAGDNQCSGVVYLHGRLGSSRQREGASSALILGSADFGRAYLADGWATSFFRQLLEKKTVVLLGYSAGDPPIRYLLEGLNSSTSAKLQPIYAFDRGEEHDVVSKWRDLGVTGIHFEEFGDLWDTLQAWASRADDPAAWRDQIIALASQKPQSLKPYQRGQIAALASTASGARAFAEAITVPCAEWLCVLDVNIRYMNSFEVRTGEDRVTVDPLAEFGLDDDPPPAENPEARGIDLLGRLPTDTDSDTYLRLSGFHPQQRSPLPRRLRFLTRWFERICHTPFALWWASRQMNLHPEIIRGVNRRLAGFGDALPSETHRAWGLLLEIDEERGDDFDDLGWFDFAGRLNQTGWSPAAFRAFEKAIRPRLKVETFGRAIPPCDHDLQLDEFLQFAVHCPSRHGQDIDFPPAAMPRIVSIVVRSLELATDLLSETGSSATVFFHLPATEPEADRGERYVAHDGPEGLFLWAVQLFKRLAEIDPSAASREVSVWRPRDRFIFDKFRLVAWKIEHLFTATAVTEGLVQLDDASFWDPYLERDVLHLLRAKWGQLSPDQRQAIEVRICNPIERFPEDEDAEIQRRSHFNIGSRLGWLERNGCNISPTASALLATARETKGWTEKYELRADNDMDSRVGFVERRADPTALEGIRISEIVARATDLSGRRHELFIEYAPFEGIVAERPSVALAALATQSRSNRYPVELWKQLLAKWPAKAPMRATMLCGLRLARLPKEVQFELRYYLPNWIRDKLTSIADTKAPIFLRIWDSVFDTLQDAGENATTSGIGEIATGRKAVPRSRKTLDHAINGPIGKLVEALIASMGERTFKKNEKVPEAIALRLERSLNSVGDGADHAASLIGRRLEWFAYVDKNWTERVILPPFALEHPLAEAAWKGLLFGQRPPSPKELFAKLKGPFLRIFLEKKEWFTAVRDERHAVNVLVVATYWSKNRGDWVTDEECRIALQAVDETGRQAALWTLHRIIAERGAWKSFGKRFFTSIWPQEARFQTSSSSDTMLRIADDRPNIFPEVVGAIKEFLRPVDHPDIFIFKQLRLDRNDNKQSLAKRWPKYVLEIADQVIGLQPSYVPHELPALLTDIAEANPSLRSTKAWRRMYALLSG